MIAVRTAKQYLTYVSSGPFQYAIAEALRLPDAYYDGLRADLRRKRNLLGDSLRTAGFEVYQPQGAYFIHHRHHPLRREGRRPHRGRRPPAAGRLQRLAS